MLTAFSFWLLWLQMQLAQCIAFPAIPLTAFEPEVQATCRVIRDAMTAEDSEVMHGAPSVVP